MGASETSNRLALQKMVAHHRTMTLELGARVDALVEAASTGGDVRAARLETLDYLRSELLPHAAAEEGTIYAAAPEAARLLVRSMVLEHERLAAGVVELEAAEGAAASATARALEWLFSIHARKENELLLPALVHSGADLAELLGSMQEAIDASDLRKRAAGSRIDVRALPHRARHERIFTRLGELEGGQSVVILNDHDPLPLRYQVEAVWPGAFEWSYLERGPEVWRVSLRRAG